MSAICEHVCCDTPDNDFHVHVNDVEDCNRCQMQLDPDFDEGDGYVPSEAS